MQPAATIVLVALLGENPWEKRHAEIGIEVETNATHRTWISTRAMRSVLGIFHLRFLENLAPNLDDFSRSIELLFSLWDYGIV